MINVATLSPVERARLATILKAKRKKDNLDRWAGDFEAFAEAQIKILPKDVTKGFIAFKMNEAQKLIHGQIQKQLKETGRVRAIILKARQQGISTYCTGRVFHKVYFESYHKSVVMAHDAPTSEALFAMSQNIVAKMDDEYRPELAKSNAREIKLADRDSGYRLYTAGSPEAGRGTTPTIAHLTEVAFWPFASQILSGLFQGIPNTDGTEVILESTANGIGNEFHRLWEGAVEGTNGYLAIFIPWFLTSEYYIEPPDNFELTADEEHYSKIHGGLLEGQMYWRRLKIGESGPLKFQQEYPATAQEAFITSGSNVIDGKKLDLYIPSAPKIWRAFDYSTNSFEKETPDKAFLKVFRSPDPKEPYVLAADPSLGVGKDYSVGVVLNKQRQVCAVYRNNRIDPSLFGVELFYLGRYYNNALLAVETNNMGIATLNKLVELQYLNLYKQTKIANVSKEESTKLGWKTTHMTKPLIISLLKNVIESFDADVPDATILGELRNYVVFEDGSTGASSGNDDTVIALAIALEVLRTHGDKLTVTSVPFWQKAGSVELDQTTWL
jgi:hypothetical protein